MVSVLRATARTNVFELIYDTLTASLSKGTVTAAFINDQPTYPQVVINPARISQDNLSLDRGTSGYNGEVEIEIYAIKAKDIDELSDEICDDLLSSEATFATGNLYLEDLKDGTTDTVFWNKQKIHIKSLSIKYNLNI